MKTNNGNFSAYAIHIKRLTFQNSIFQYFEAKQLVKFDNIYHIMLTLTAILAEIKLRIPKKWTISPSLYVLKFLSFSNAHPHASAFGISNKYEIASYAWRMIQILCIKFNYCSYKSPIAWYTHYIGYTSNHICIAFVQCFGNCKRAAPAIKLIVCEGFI